jgi:hypothetical protein
VTLLPSNNFGIRGHEGKPYKVDPICAHPTCGRPSVHAHHLWPRSYLRGQPYDWVEHPRLDPRDEHDMIIGNRVGLCVEHHEMVTGEVGGYRARIVFEGGVFYWHDRVIVTSSASAAKWEGEPDRIWRNLGPLWGQPPGSMLHGLENAPKNGDVCPECGKPKHKRPAMPKRAARKTRAWTLTVPDDVEIGAEILDEWCDDIAVILGFSDESSRLRRYHAAATALAYVVQNRADFVHDVVEASR